MNHLKMQWLEGRGPYYCLDWVNKMEDELLEEVTIMTPTKYDHSLKDPYLDLVPMVYTIEDFLRYSPKGKLHTSLESILFS
ncbi:TPA: hypothetical protein OXS70_002145 [Acinetobacter baumannii]|nr:hypothetical protein [Acinetobacter baumannii]EKX9959433.1 hypothetical protein [Acinetobacter baumannii]EKY0928450.1 hypothetical protein [Acinetobacter baumannii]EKY1173495.1 hypothetical protein [Acinetobacter baumannii]HCW3947873.1 hypothetical protein [Acinetobacter baumannii]